MSTRLVRIQLLLLLQPFTLGTIVRIKGWSHYKGYKYNIGAYISHILPR